MKRGHVAFDLDTLHARGIEAKIHHGLVNHERDTANEQNGYQLTFPSILLSTFDIECIHCINIYRIHSQ
jgi:hypothetical protein